MKPNWRELFVLFKQERKSFLIFSVLVSLVITARITAKYWYPNQAPELEYLAKKVRFDTLKSEPTAFEKVELVNRIPIDINDAGLKEWEQLGFSKKQADVIINYRNKVGGFDSTHQLLQVFVVDSIRYFDIEPFIYLTQVNVATTKIVEQNQGKKKMKLESFNPNNTSIEELTHLGFSLKQANNVISYRDRVKPFEIKSDFRKLYTISDSFYYALEPYLLLPDSIQDLKLNRDSSFANRIAESIPSININTCDSLELISLRGIGPYYAYKILAYRKKLGGYVSVNQLHEIKGIRPESLSQIKSYFYVDENFTPQKIDINSDNFKEFLRHPYFDYYHTKKLFDYRNQHGKFTSLHALKNVGYIEKDYVEKIQPYLKIDSSDTRKD